MFQQSKEMHFTPQFFYKAPEEEGERGYRSNFNPPNLLAARVILVILAGTFAASVFFLLPDS